MTKAKAKSSIEKVEEEVPSVSGESDDDYDDEAPDAVSFNQGREEALESISNALRDLQRTKLKAKERRRERDKLLKEQKQKKKVSLSNARLPPDFLNKLGEQQDAAIETSEKSQDSEQLQTKTASSEKRTESPKEDDDDNDFGEDGDDDDDDDDDLDLDEDEDEDWKWKKRPSNIHIMQSSKIVHPPPHKAALQFLQNQMYGSRIPRESMVKYISRKMKRYEKPGLNFCQNKPQGVKKKKKKGTKRT